MPSEPDITIVLGLRPGFWCLSPFSVLGSVKIKFFIWAFGCAPGMEIIPASSCKLFIHYIVRSCKFSIGVISRIFENLYFNVTN